MYLDRTLSKMLSLALNAFPAVLLTGPRQSGKTTFLRHELNERYDYVSFDDPLEWAFASSDPNGFLRRFDQRPALLDEVQYVPELFFYLKLRIDAAPEQLGRWLLTCSQQFGLMQHIGESITECVAILELLPFSALEHKGRCHRGIAPCPGGPFPPGSGRHWRPLMHERF